FTTTVVSYGFGIGDAKAGSSRMAVGLTAKWVVGHAVVMGRDIGSQTTPNDVHIAFPVVQTDTNQVGNSGTGFGADVGFAWSADKLTFGAAVQNLLNSFAWDESKLAFRPGTATFTVDSTSSNFDEQPFANAPQTLKDAITNNKFKPTIAA